MPQKVNPKLSMGIMANCQKLYALSSMILSAAHRPFEGDAYANVIYDTGCGEAMEVAIGLFVRTEALVAGLRPDTERMRRNLDLTGGLIFSEGIMMKVAQTRGKHDAHDLVYDAAMTARRENKPFFELLAATDLKDMLFEDVGGKLQLRTEDQFGISADIARDFGARAQKLSQEHRQTREASPAARLRRALNGRDRVGPGRRHYCSNCVQTFVTSS